MFVSGTKDFPQDHWDDLKIPFNLTAESLRYRNADQALKHNELLNPEQQITSLVGHSLGGSVVLEMQKQYPDRSFKTTTYGAPVKSITTPDNIDNKIFRNIGDPVYSLDRGATSAVKPSLLMNLASIITDNNTVHTSGVVLQALDNHSYAGFGKQQIDNTSRGTFVYRTDEQINTI
jgi:pimeloyl-ACP methyl ester carboxylesterase